MVPCWLGVFQDLFRAARNTLVYAPSILYSKVDVTVQVNENNLAYETLHPTELSQLVGS